MKLATPYFDPYKMISQTCVGHENLHCSLSMLWTFVHHHAKQKVTLYPNPQKESTLS